MYIMERKIILISILSVIAILSLVALVTGSFGYITFSLFGFPILFYTQREVFSKIQWIIMITLLLLITVASVNLLANLKGHFLYYYEFLATMIILGIALAWTPDREEVKE